MKHFVTQNSRRAESLETVRSLAKEFKESDARYHVESNAKSEDIIVKSNNDQLRTFRQSNVSSKLENSSLQLSEKLRKTKLSFVTNRI